MIPISGMDVYNLLINANRWVRTFLPNGFPESNSLLFEVTRKRAPAFQSLLELPLRGRIGDRFEKWEMDRKVSRFSNYAGFGAETIFHADVCQGNFHHHRSLTRDKFESQLAALAAVRGELDEYQSPRTATGAYRQ